MSEIDGLWTAEGATPEGWPTSGILMFVRGQVFGGGNRYYCLGRYRLQGQRIEIEAHTYHYHGSNQTHLAEPPNDGRGN